MSEKDNNQPKPEAQPQTKITAAIFTKPIMASENRVKPKGTKLQTLHEKVITRNKSFTKNGDK